MLFPVVSIQKIIIFTLSALLLRTSIFQFWCKRYVLWIFVCVSMWIIVSGYEDWRYDICLMEILFVFYKCFIQTWKFAYAALFIPWRFALLFLLFIKRFIGMMFRALRAIGLIHTYIILPKHASACALVVSVLWFVSERF